MKANPTTPETPVLFYRIRVMKAEGVTAALSGLYKLGWRVVSHCESGGEYSFVLEQR